MRYLKNTKALILFILITQSVTAQVAGDELLLKHFHSITSEEMAGWMTTLCSPEFNGRLAGTPEYIASAEWVAGNLEAWGIKPSGDNGTYFQWFKQS
ncbi:MAG TPA: hypothetical protein VMV74_00520, partial [Bacteroidales bacterium]|nr:hypothetical protein [Bacteroidales bacterium]